jgi:hypothetical protein
MVAVLEREGRVVVRESGREGEMEGSELVGALMMVGLRRGE